NAWAEPLISSMQLALPGLAGFQSTAKRETLGATSLSSPRRFAHSSSLSVASPVTFPPGPRQARHQAGLDGVRADLRHDDGNRLRRLLGGNRRRFPGSYDDIDRRAHQLGRELGKPVDVAGGVAILDRHVAPLDVANVAQALLKVA